MKKVKTKVKTISGIMCEKYLPIKCVKTNKLNTKLYEIVN
jgi:hypothetical protein